MCATTARRPQARLQVRCHGRRRARVGQQQCDRQRDSGLAFKMQRHLGGAERIQPCVSEARARIGAAAPRVPRTARSTDGARSS